MAGTVDTDTLLVRLAGGRSMNSTNVSARSGWR